MRHTPETPDRTETADNVPAPTRPTPAARALLTLSIVAGLLLTGLGVAYSGSQRRSCGDAWIALAAGRLICERGYRQFPVADEFTWTFTGRTWYNQNWLYHVLMYSLYDRVFPAALVGLKLASLLAMAGLMIHCAYMMCREVLLGTVLAVAALAAGTPLWEIRPSLGGHLLACLVLWTLVAATYRRAAWGLLLLPILLTWSNTHGGFVFGYVLVAAWIGGEVAERFLHRAWRRMSAAAIATVGGAALASVPMGAWLSPYGWENFTHPLLVMRSRTFQRVFEWHSPFFPNVSVEAMGDLRAIQTPFFLALGVWGLCLVVGFLTRDWARRQFSLAKVRVDEADLSGVGRGITLGEVAVAVLAAYLAARHIRFLPTLYTLATPLLTKFIAIRIREAALAWSLARTGRRRPGRGAGRVAACTAAIAAAAMIAGLGRDRIANAYVDAERRPWRQGMFLHHVKDSAEPRPFTRFAVANGLSGRLFTHWIWGGYVLFEWPAARVFADGRSQALFDEKMYLLFHELERMNPPTNLPPAARGEQIDRALERPDVPTGLGAEMVLVRATGATANNWVEPLLATGKWVPVLWTAEAMLMIRRTASSPGLPEALSRAEDDALTWPDDEWGLASRALAAQFLRTPNHARAIRHYQAAAEKAPYASFYWGMLASFLNEGRTADGIAYYTQQRDRLRRDACDLSPSARTESLQALTALLKTLEAAPQR